MPEVAVTEPVAARQVDFIRLDHSISNLYPEGWGHLYGVTRNAVQYTDEVARGRVQADLDHVATGALIIYVFALLEDVFPKPDWSSDLMNPARLERMLAYRHLRNTAAHSMDGSRATQNQDEVGAFEEVMNGGSPINGIVSWDASNIRMSQGAATECLGQVQVVAGDATSIVLNPDSPPPF
jgi:hypothetical protein